MNVGMPTLSVGMVNGEQDQDDFLIRKKSI